MQRARCVPCLGIHCCRVPPSAGSRSRVPLLARGLLPMLIVPQLDAPPSSSRSLGAMQGFTAAAAIDAGGGSGRRATGRRGGRCGRCGRRGHAACNASSDVGGGVEYIVWLRPEAASSRRCISAVGEGDGGDGSGEDCGLGVRPAVVYMAAVRMLRSSSLPPLASPHRGLACPRTSARSTPPPRELIIILLPTTTASASGWLAVHLVHLIHLVFQHPLPLRRRIGMQPLLSLQVASPPPSPQDAHIVVAGPSLAPKQPQRHCRPAHAPPRVAAVERRRHRRVARASPRPSHPSIPPTGRA
ncbi:hypothetical protein C8R46DRAFT_582227 [Mycena filopes]|nr:hypothetical protein C8R46DRAFT_582227 [Mycena filopes]